MAVLENASVFAEKEWFWFGAAGLLAFIIMFNILFTLALIFLDRKYTSVYTLSVD